jgi:hypothetical protein
VSDQDRFDDLARGLAATSSRREVLKLSGVAAAAGVLGLVRVPAAFAGHKPKHRCRRLGEHCGNDKHCCSGDCDRQTHRCAPRVGCQTCGPCSSDSDCPAPCDVCCLGLHCGGFVNTCVTSSSC